MTFSGFVSYCKGTCDYDEYKYIPGVSKKVPPFDWK